MIFFISSSSKAIGGFGRAVSDRTCNFVRYQSVVNSIIRNDWA